MSKVGYQAYFSSIYGEAEMKTRATKQVRIRIEEKRLAWLQATAEVRRMEVNEFLEHIIDRTIRDGVDNESQKVIDAFNKVLDTVVTRAEIDRDEIKKSLVTLVHYVKPSNVFDVD